MGVLPSTLKSKALCVYFQMYSPLTTDACRMPAARWRETRSGSPAEDSQRHAGDAAEHTSSGASTALAHPLLESTRFSLNGVSSVRA